MNLDWAAYGTEDLGHALLGASGDISIASELTQFTDRPGNPPSGQDWGPVTSGFPFKTFYVVLRTMPDTHAKRSGMVRSYAAFIPLENLGGLNSLTELVSVLPTRSNFTICEKMESIKVSGQPPKFVPTDSKEFETTILGMCAPELEQPVVWGLEKDYLPTLDAIWSKIPISLRQKFSFSFQFAPDHPFPTPCAFIATAPGFANRWSGKWIIDKPPTQGEMQSGIIEWFRKDSKVTKLDEILRSYDLRLQTLQELRLLDQFSALIQRLDSLNFEELTKVVRILEKFSAGASESRKDARNVVFKKLCDSMLSASAEELLTLRNLRTNSLPALIKPAKDSLKNWLSDAESNNRSGETIELVEAALDEPDNWWSQPFIDWLKEISFTPSKRNAEKLLSYVLRSQKAAAFALDRLRFSERKWEDVLLNILPSALDEVNRPNAIVLSAKHKWHRMTAYCVSQLTDRQIALITYINSSNGSTDGYAILLDEWSFLGLMEAVDEHGDLKALSFLSTEISNHLDQVSESVVLQLKNPKHLLKESLASETGPLKGKIRKWVALLIDRDLDAELIEAVLSRDSSVLLDLEKPVTAIDAIETNGAEIRRSFSKFIAAGLLEQQILFGSDKESWMPIVDLNLIAQELADDPFAHDGMAGIAAFTMFDGFTDEHCARWLAEYFRVSNTRGGVGDVARKGIIGLLLENNFPRSAQIVKETVEQFNRGDASPILDAIRERYQGFNAPKRKNKLMEKLPKVFVATALLLEYEAVKSYLRDREYDEDLEVDFGFWPSSDAPLATIYLSITGAGNLASQASALEVFRRVKPDCAFFMGIGGGIKDLHIGDVAYGVQVDYIEGGKESGKGEYASRPKTEQTNGKLVNLAHRIASDAQDPGNAMRTDYKILPAVIVSGENVLASNEDEASQFQIIKNHYNDGQVIEMEGFGFMRAARVYRIEFCMIIRGISDLCKGKGESDDLRNQPLAAKNATDFLFRLLPDCLSLTVSKSQLKKIKDKLVAWKKSLR